MPDLNLAAPNPFQPSPSDGAEPASFAPQVVPPNASCIKCAYSLAGLPFSGVCPECGTSVADSLRGTLLQFAGRDYLVTLGKGLAFVLNGILILVLTTMGLVGGSILATQGYADLQTVQLLGSIAMTLVSFAILWGYWMFTELDPGSANLEEQKSARKLARTCVLIQAGTTVLSLGVQVFMATARPPGTTNASQAFDTTMLVVTSVVGLIAMIAWVVQFIALMRYLRLLARRVPDAYIEKRSKTYMWLLPVLQTVGTLACGLGPLVALVLYWNILHRLRQHVKSILKVGTPAKLAKMSVGG